MRLLLYVLGGCALLVLAVSVWVVYLLLGSEADAERLELVDGHSARSITR